MHQQHEKLLYRVGEAAEALGLSRATIWRLVSSGRLNAVRVGRAVRVPADDLLRFLKEIREQQRSP